MKTRHISQLRRIGQLLQTQPSVLRREKIREVRTGVFSLCLSTPMSLIPFLFCVDPPRTRFELFWSAVA